MEVATILRNRRRERDALIRFAWFGEILGVSELRCFGHFKAEIQFRITI
jgi:hypothetical protein